MQGRKGEWGGGEDAWEERGVGRGEEAHRQAYGVGGGGA
jgi:hypothetical protein